MDGQRIGRAFRAVRVRQGLRHVDVAAAAHVDPSMVSRIERGQVGRVSIERLERIAKALDIQLTILPRWHGGELDRLLSARHSAMHEAFARFLKAFPEWLARPEVSFSIYGERGAIDVLARHAPTRTLLVIELKTELVDMQDLVGVIDRKRKLAPRIARDLGWDVGSVSVWVVVAASRSNRRAIEGHRTFLASAFPVNGREMRGWLHRPAGAVAVLPPWQVPLEGRRHGGPSCVRVPRRKVLVMWPNRDSLHVRSGLEGAWASRCEPVCPLTVRPSSTLPSGPAVTGRNPVRMRPNVHKIQKWPGPVR